MGSEITHFLHKIFFCRRASYRFLAEKVHIKSLTIGQREGVLQRGLKERSETSRKVEMYIFASVFFEKDYKYVFKARNSFCV